MMGRRRAANSCLKLYDIRKTLRILFVFAVCTVTTEACGEYGDGMKVAECTRGFPTLFYIDEVLGNTNLDTASSRQVLIPGINFTCNGTISKWIFGANWRGSSLALTEFQIWRRISNTGSTYTKIAETTIRVGSRNSSGVYEYPLDSPIPFQEGDILGYFQPIFNELDLYLEDSHRITTYHQSSPAGTTFSLTTAFTDTHYPLIAATTTPVDCGCGFMSAGRVYSLLTSTGDGDVEDFRDSVLILFPSLTFTCSGKILKWLLAGRYREFNNELPKISLWRKLGNSSSVYKRVNNTTTALWPLSEEREDGVYEFIPTTPVTAKPGDIVGLYIPDDSVFRPDYNEDDDNDDDGETLYYWNRDKENQDSYFNILDSRTRYGSPLITVEISPQRLNSPSTPLQPHGTNNIHNSLMTTATLSPIQSPTFQTKQSTDSPIQSPKFTTKQSMDSPIQSPDFKTKQSTSMDSKTPTIVGSAVSALIFTAISSIFILLFIIWRRRYLKKKCRSLPTMETDSTYIQRDHMYAYASHPTVCSITQQNTAYNAHSFDDKTETPFTATSSISSGKPTDKYLCEENYEKVMQVRGEDDVPVVPNTAYASTFQLGYDRKPVHTA